MTVPSRFGWAEFPPIIGRTKLVRIMCWLFFGLWLVPSVHAQTVFSWTGGGGDDRWGNSKNWSTSSVPPTGATVVIDFASRSGPYTINASSTDVISLGSLTLNSSLATLQLNQTSSAVNFNLVSGTLGQNAKTGVLFATGTFSWTGGRVSATTVTASGTASIAPANGTTVDGSGNVVVNGAGNWRSGIITLSNGQLTVAGKGDLDATGDVSLLSKGTDLFSIQTGGIFRKSTVSSVSIEPLTNNLGTISAEAGTFLFQNKLNNLASGTNKGKIQGNGTVTISGSGSIVNNGLVSPGVNGAGALLINGATTNATTLIEIGGTKSVSQYDVLNIGGVFTYKGVLDVSLLNGFSPALDETYKVVQFTSTSGLISDLTYNFPTLTPGLGWTALHNPTDITLKIIKVNQAPVSNNDSYSTSEDKPLTVVAAGVLANDTDPDGDKMTAIPDALPTKGTLTLNTNGSFTYTPNPNFNGTDSFIYHASDGSLNATPATVTISIRPVNDAPIATADTYTGDEDNTLNVAATAGVLKNDSDPDGDKISASVLTSPANGTVSMSSDGAFIYTPNANFNGADSFTYQVSDGLLSVAETVNLTIRAVNDAPAANRDAYATKEDETITVSATGVLGNDSDLDGDQISAVLDAKPVNGTLTLNTDGSFTYLPNLNFNGTDSFTYHASDGKLSSSSMTVTITVQPINDPPVTVKDSYTTDEDQVLTIILSNNFRLNDYDVDGDAFTAVKVSDPANGNLVFHPDGTFTYTPKADFNGTDSFLYQLNDGALNSTPTSVNIVVRPVNDAPIAQGDNYSLAEDQTLNVPFSSRLTLNDADVDGDVLSVILDTGVQTGAQLSLQPDGTFTYTPPANFAGADSFRYKVTDGFLQSAATTVSLNITAVNDPPAFTKPSDRSAFTNQAISFDLTGISPGGGTDEAPQTVTLSATSGNTALFPNANITLGPIVRGSATITLTPVLNAKGTALITITANDGQTAQNTYAVSFNATITDAPNTAPTAVNDAFSTVEDQILNVAAKGVLANDTDPENNTLSAILRTSPAKGSLILNADGSFKYTPNPNYFGTDSFTYMANDGRTDSPNPATVTITITAVNDAPSASADTYTINEDITLSVPTSTGLLSNDADLEGDALTALLVQQPTQGNLSLQTNGAFQYVPAQDFFGTDTFTYKANDGKADSPVVTVTINVKAVNDAPVAANNTYFLDEDTAFQASIDQSLWQNDHDVDTPSDQWGTSIVQSPTHGTLQMGTFGQFTYTPNPDFNGLDTFQYQLSDGQSTSNIATVTLDVSPVNDPPIARNDTYATDEDQSLSISASGVLANDADPEGVTMIASLKASPANGALNFQPDGSFVYTPKADFYGTDTFTYFVQDAAGAPSPDATVTITVRSVNDAPVTTSDRYTALEDQTLTVSIAEGVLANDRDIDSATLTATLVSGTTKGTLSFQSDGSFAYTPQLNVTGSDSFTYRVSDGALSATTSVSLSITPVNDAPTINKPANQSALTNQPVTVTLAGIGPGGGADEANQSVTISAQSSNTALVDASGISLSGISGGQATLVLTPKTGQTGVTTITVSAKDGQAGNGQTDVSFTLTVANAPNQKPVAQPDAFNATEDTPLDVTAANGVLKNDSDPDGNPMTAVLVSLPAKGNLSLNADGSFRYTPNTNQTGTDAFTYRANDGKDDSNTATVTLTIQAVNDAPIATQDRYTTDEDVPLTASATNGVLANDADVEGSTLTAVLLKQPAKGSVSLNPDGAFVYTPNANANGADAFTYKVSDGQADSPETTVSVTINAVNDAPVAKTDAYNATEDTPLTVSAAQGLAANDTDADGDALTISLVSDPAQGTLSLNADGGFTYTPAKDFNGNDSFTYQTSDGQVKSAVMQVSIRIAAVNDAPTGLPDAFTLTEDASFSSATSVLVNDADVDRDALTAVLESRPAHGSLNLLSNGQFTFTPDADYAGTDAFTYRANDGLATSASVTVSLTITPVNDPPTVFQPANQSMLTNETLTFSLTGISAGGGSDETNQTVSVSVSSGNPTLFPPGSIQTAAVSGGSATVRITPALNQTGTAIFTVVVNDGQSGNNTASKAFQVSVVSKPNGKPVAQADAYTVIEDTPFTLSNAANGVLGNDNDPDADALTAVLVAQPQGTLSLNNNGTFTYTPPDDFSGNDAFTYRASDGVDESAVTVVALTVTAVNDAPIPVADTFSTDEDVTLNVSAPGLLANDTDVENNPLHAKLETALSGLALNTDGSLKFIPPADQNGTFTFTYRANDGTVDSGSAATVTLTVNPVNDPPVIQKPADATMAESATATVQLTGIGPGGGADEAQQPITLSATANLETLFPAGSLTIGTLSGGNATLTLKPAAGQSGSALITVFVQDGQSENQTTSVTFGVTVSQRPNQKPVATNDAYSVDQDVTLAVPVIEGVLVNDSDPDNDPLTAQLGTTTANGVLALEADGRFVYKPQAGFTGIDTFTYRANDGALNSDPGTVTITVRAVQANHPPAAQADESLMPMNTRLTVRVLTNDSDPDNDPLTVKSVTNPAHGTATIQADQSILYTPSRSYIGTDSFSYAIEDGRGGTASATINVTITPPTFTITAINPNKSRAMAINDKGQVAGVQLDAAGNLQAFFWNGTTLAILKDAASSQAFAVNDNGQLTGALHNSDGSDEAFVWNGAGNLNRIGSLGGDLSIGYGISADGQVVGASRTAQGRINAFRYQSSLQNLHTFGDALQSEAYDINLRGDVVGVLHDGTGGAKGFLNTSALPETDSRAYRISNTGTILGSVLNATSGVISAQLWTTSETQVLPPLKGSFSEVYGLNDEGWAVGASAFTTNTQREAFKRTTLSAHITDGASQWTQATPDLHATIWITRQPYDLNTLIPNAAPGWLLLEARDVNSRGEITGYGLLNGEPRAFLLTPQNNVAPRAHKDVITQTAPSEIVLNVLANDGDPDGDALTLLTVWGNTQDDVTWSPEGEVRIRPHPAGGQQVLRYVVGDGSGASQVSEIVLTFAPVATEIERPTQTELRAPYPNPFSQQASLSYALSQTVPVQLTLYDLMGRHVKTLVQDNQGAGVYTIPLHAEALASGTYFVQLRAGQFLQTRRITLRR